MIVYFEKNGLKCEKGNFSYPIRAHRMDLLCTRLEKARICPEHYKIVIPYDVKRKLSRGQHMLIRENMLLAIE